MKGLVVLVAAVAVASVAVASAEFNHTKVTSDPRADPRANPVLKIGRERQRRLSVWPFSSNPNEYSCQISPHVTFYPADNSPPMPAYLCTNGQIEVVIATRNFNLGFSGFEYATYTTVNIEPSILHVEYPGYFTETAPSLVYKHSKGTPQSAVVDITGLLFLTDGGIQRQKRLFQFLQPTLYSCHFVPFAAFYNEHIGELPVYRCIRGQTEILIASESFRGPYDPYEFSQALELNIGNEILDVYYPGSFIPTAVNKFRANPALTHQGGEFFVQGLLRLADF